MLGSEVRRLPEFAKTFGRTQGRGNDLREGFEVLLLGCQGSR